MFWKPKTLELKEVQRKNKTILEEKVEKTEKEAMELMHKQKKRYMEKDEKVKGLKDFIGGWSI